MVLTDDADQFIGDVLRWLVVSAAISLALGAVVAAVLSRRLTAPMRQARDATRLIAEGDLSARVPVDERIRDEISDLSASINEMAESLERSQSLERQFLMSISHDLRTPLTSIRGYGEAIADGTADDQQQAAEVIVSEAERLERLVSDLLDLARLDAREFTLEHRPVEVGVVAEEVGAGFAPRAADRGVELRVGGPGEASEPPVTAWCDPGRLAQVDRQPGAERAQVRRFAGGAGVPADPPRQRGLGCHHRGRRRPRYQPRRPAPPVRAPVRGPAHAAAQRSGLGPGPGHRGRADRGHGRPSERGRPLSDRNPIHRGTARNRASLDEALARS